jgi:uncharacterized protein YkwD
MAANTPSGVTPKAQGVSYRYVGENLAGNQTVEKAHVALMNSAGNGPYLLNPNYIRIGSSILQGLYGPFFVAFHIGVSN